MGFPGVYPKSTGPQVREQHLGPHLEENEMETKTFQRFQSDSTTRPGRFQRTTWWAPR